jgi:hypothetical protein
MGAYLAGARPGEDAAGPFRSSEAAAAIFTNQAKRM